MKNGSCLISWLRYLSIILPIPLRGEHNITARLLLIIAATQELTLGVILMEAFDELEFYQA